MMRGRKQNNSDEAKVDLTPMLDVVFILLIFFIVTSTFIQEKALGAEPPPPSGGDNSQPAPAIQVYVDNSNIIRVNGVITDILSVQPTMQRLRAENPEVSLIIQADRRAQTGIIIRLRDIAYDAKMDRVNIVASQVQE